MTAPAPTAMEQAAIDRLGVFDEEKFAEIIGQSGDGPVCDDSKCEGTATFTVNCNRCDRFVGIVCTPHAKAIERSTVVAQHSTCGAFDRIRDLLKVVPL